MDMVVFVVSQGTKRIDAINQQIKKVKWRFETGTGKKAMWDCLYTVEATEVIFQVSQGWKNETLGSLYNIQ